MKFRILFIIFSAVFPAVGLTDLHAQTRADLVAAALEESPKAKWWQVMDTGPFTTDTFRFGPKGDTAVLKGVALKTGPEEKWTMVFDPESMRMVAGFEGNVTLAGTPWDGKHGGNSSLPEDRSKYYFTTNWGPGWAINGDWTDPREKDNDRANGSLPDDYAEYHGIYRHEGGSVLSYTIAGTPVLEKPGLVAGQMIRFLALRGAAMKALQVLVSDPMESGGKNLSSRLVNAPEGVTMETLDSGRKVVSIPAGTPAGELQIIYSRSEIIPAIEIVVPDWDKLTKGGPALFPETIVVSGRVSEEDDAPYVIDSIPLPTDNPWKSEIRFGAFDFFPDGKRLAASTWNGDVWIAEGIDGDLDEITWKRYASGLFQTLGLTIVNGTIYTHGRDQLTRLHDLNNDGEADFYESFNNDVNITEGFHEFAFDLQTDAEGNFYFSKGQPVLSGGRGFAPWTEHNGTVLKVSADGKKLERVAWGLRAPGGVGIGPDGQITTGENEGSYVPRCKITWSKRGVSGNDISFHGVVPSVWEDKQFIKTLPGTPTDYERPLCWLPYYVDNSSGSQFWVPEDSGWKNHAGGMLHLSYGKSSVYRALIDEVDGQVQGGVYRLPIELTTAAMRGRFHPKTGNLYIIGFRGWQTNGGKGLQRIRFNGIEKPVPMSLKAHKNGIVVSFSDSLNPTTASDPRRYSVSKWDYVWGPMYGSGRFSIDDRDDAARAHALEEHSKGSHNQIDTVPVRAATLLEDGKSVFLYIPNMTPAMQMEIKMDLAAADEKSFRETIWNTVHLLRPEFEEHGLDLTNLPEINTAPVGEPGLILSMAHGSTDDAVVVDRLAITLAPGEAATPFIDPRRGREMVFQGSLIVDARDQRHFRLDGSGWASLRIDGKTVVEGTLPIESKVPVELEAGPHTLFCNFQREEDGNGRLQLMWSGTEFTWESVRPDAFRYLPNALLEAKNKTRRGRNLFAAVGCIRCHSATTKLVSQKNAMPELLETVPDFIQIGERINPGWIEQWVRRPKDNCPGVAPDSAADIAAFLAKSTRNAGGGEPPAGDPEKGKELAATLHFQPWVEALSAEAKFTSTGLVRFLQNPAAHHSDTTFPNLRLSEPEAADLAAWIRSQQPEVKKLSGGDSAKGGEMVSKRCLVCHSNGTKRKYQYEFAAKPLDEMWEQEWLVHGCLSEEEGNAPELGLSLEDKQALLAFKNVDSNHGLRSLNRFVPHEYAHRTLDRLRCAECHSGKNTLPDISLAGEKLRDDWLTGLFRGDVLKIRPYQKAKMPSFSSRADLLARGLAHRSGETTGEELEAPDPPLADVGKQIAGFQGYACASCHAVGPNPAIQAFEGQGPNLQLAGERLREKYYHGWMHWPQRFIPTTIMPRYTVNKETALNPNFFGGKAEEQFEALWQWMRTLEGAEKAPLVVPEH
ncbi:MAG: c-type cytochrome [Verrucomicrobiales bacterium]|nr:c-type cytochrome [Verrucomicrobiales bacterium]